MVIRDKGACDVQMLSSSSSSSSSAQKDKWRASRSGSVWMIDVKSFLAGMVMVGFLVLVVGNFRGNQSHSFTYLDFRDQKQHGGGINQDNYDDLGPIKSTINSSEPNCNTNMSRDYVKDGNIDQYNHSRDYANHSYDPFNKPTSELKESDNAHHQSKDYINDDYDTHHEDDMVTKKRSFRAYGQALALFVHMGSYRGGPDTFAVIGLGAKPAHVYGNASFECEWVPSRPKGNSIEGMTDLSGNNSIKGRTMKLLPDWNMGRQYTVVVVNCSFEQPVGVDGGGGKLVVYALYGEGSGRWNTTPERFIALTEKKNEYDAAKFRPPYPYDFVYCGSPIYGKVSTQRMREWMAYHAKLFGKRTHFFFHDAGGITASVERALRPWRKRGYVTVQDIREQEQFDGYYHNQFLVVNDCLHRTRFLSEWTFFFDVDEYLYVPKKESLGSVMQGFSNYTQVIFRQKPMAAHICPQPHHRFNISRKWGFEKLVFRNVKAGITWDRKYAIQPRRAFTTGVHRSDYIVGDNIVRDSLGYFPESLVPKLWYYHFHNTINYLGELCRTFVHTTNKPTNSSFVALAALEPVNFYDTDGTPFRLDTGLQELAQSIKDFELQQIGPQPHYT